MATLRLLFLAAACLSISAFPQEQRKIRNTIFGDEKLEGEIFEHLDNQIFAEEITPFNEDNPYRLPTTTKPIHYNILWTIDIENLAYSGAVEIDLQATQAGVNEIVIHSSHTAITSVQLTQNGVALPQPTYVQEEQYHFLRIRPTAALTYNAQNPVTYRLIISFNAVMREDMYGIYKSWFTNTATEVERWMATTQFQATAARFAFPCYDEPSFKATFDIVIRRPTTHRSWTCTRLRETVTGTPAGYEDDIYHTTPIMSTYLLALIVAEYDTIELLQNGQLMYEVIARPGAITTGQGEYAFEVGQELLASMNEHTAIDFYSTNPNIKMTQAAIPDFGAGAMENWGLLTYREAYLMYDPVHTNGYFKQMIAYILSHEIAHMWFGNLVTCDWWDVLWLNEGFARYYQYYLTHWVEDYMGLATRFITEQMHTALLSDSANNPHPLSHSGVGSPSQVSNMFSTLSYNKGAAIIRMTEHLLGHDVHRAGLRNYLTRRSFDTALPIDLFENLQEAGVSAGAITEYGPGFSIIDYYKSWTEQAGHPVLNVEVDHQSGNMFITQRRFNINTGYSGVNTNWIIPINFASASNRDFTNTKPTHIINDTLTIINRGSVGDEWVVFNKQQIGYYRVNYDEYTWNLIVIALRGQDRTSIHEYNRAQIVNDVFQFARSGLMSYTRAFNILSFLENETEYAPWVAAMVGFTWIRNRIVGSGYLNQLEAMITQWATTVMNEITYLPSPNESFMRSYLRYQLAPIMCAMNVRACRDAANAQFRNLVNNGVEVPADSRNWVYCNGLREGSQADFNFLWNRFLNHNVYTEKILLLQTLGCTPHQASLNTFLDGIVQENYIIRRQDYTTAFNSAATGNEVNTQIVFQYIQNNLQLCINAFGTATTPLSYVSSRLRTEQEIQEFQAWATANQAELQPWYNAVYNGAENSRESLRWAAEVSDDMRDYLNNGGEDYVTSTIIPTDSPPIITSSRPILVEPNSPDLPDSAATTYLSMVLVALAIVNVAFIA